jgi:hypothetical protein
LPFGPITPWRAGDKAISKAGLEAPAGIGPWEPTESVPGLHYGGDQYVYNWKTSKSWAGTCREFDLILADGRHFRIKVNFK